MESSKSRTIFAISKPSMGSFREKTKRHRLAIQIYVKVITKHWLFSGIILLTILLNSLLMALGTIESLQIRFFEFFDVTEQLFLSIYIMEFVLKLYAEPVKYWKSGSNDFDFVVLLLSVIQRIITTKQERGLGLIRAVHSLRTLRTISFIRGLQVLSAALMKTIKSVLYILFLLFLLLFVFALIGFYFFKNGNEQNVQHWGSLRAAFFTLFNMVTLDSWTDFQPQTQQNTLRWNRIFTIGFILLGCFLFFNLFIGVIIINIRESDKEFNKAIIAEREALLLQKKQAIVFRQQEHIKNLMEKQKTSQFESFGEKVQNFKTTLRHDDYILTDDLCCSLPFIDIYFTILDQQDDTLYKLQNLYFELSYLLGNMLKGEGDSHNVKDELDEESTEEPDLLKKTFL